MGAKIWGLGSYFPKRLVSNQELSLTLETSHEWIQSRTGINQRYLSCDEESNSFLATQAALLAIKNSGIDKNDIDLIVLATTTPDYSFPSVASVVQKNLGIHKAPSFDVQAVCSGFIYGMHIAHAFLISKKAQNILLIGSEKMSSLLDFQDRTSCILFGDGAAACILSDCKDSDSDIIDSIICSDGEFFDVLHSDGGVSSTGTAGKLRMQGKETFKHAVQKITDICQEILSKNNLSVDDLDYFIPHQANIRIIDAIRDRLQIDDAKVIKTIADHANCSAASIPLAFDVLVQSGKLKRGDKILFAAFGAGFTWGAVLCKY